MKDANFMVSSKANVLFGNNMSQQTGKKLKEAGISKAICIYDAGFEGTGKVKPILESLEHENISYFTFNGVKSDAPIETVEACAKIARENKVEAIIGIGGGSSIDTAKAVNVLINNPSPLSRYFDFTLVQKPGVFLVAIPTTAGTGSEVTKGAVIFDTEKNIKASVFGKNCTSNLAIIDPLLALGSPSKLTAGTGMDVLAHIISIYTSASPSPWNDILNEAGIKIVAEYLPKAVENINDEEARAQMSFACLLAGIAMADCPPHLDHAFAHSIGTLFHIHHGVACALAIPYTLKYIATLYPQRVHRIGELMGFCIPTNTPQQDQLTAIIYKFNKFNERINIGKLSDYGTLDDTTMWKLTDMVMSDMCFFMVPGKISRNEVYRLIKEMYELS